MYDGKIDYLPESVKDWLGVSQEAGEFTNKFATCSLGNLNDAGSSFDVIAEIIESEPKGLFIPCTS